MAASQLQTLRLQVLGAPSIKDESGATPRSLGWGKPFALLCLLAVRKEASRDEVVDLLWRDVEETRARNAFRQALHRLRSALGDDLVPQDRERLRLVRSSQLSVDLDQFENAAASGRLDDALQLYTGDFLETATLGEPPFDLWAENERTRLKTTFRQLLQDAVAQAAGSGRWVEAIARSRRLLAIAPFEASAAQLAATTLVSAGRRLEALELLRQFGSRLESELGLPMPPELQSLLTRMERQHERQHERPPSEATKAGVGRPAGAGDFTLPFVGRASELSQLLTLWRTGGDDAGALALVEAEAGLGKTRLARELALHAKSLGPALVLNGCERAAGAQLPFGVFAEALRPLVHAQGVVGASRHLLAEAARLLPELRDELDLPDVADVEDEAARLRFFEGIAALIDAAAFEQPILLLLEDLQFVAPSSLELLSYLSVRLAGSAVTFVLTVRPSEATASTLTRLRALSQPSAVSTPAHGARAQLLALSPLSAADSLDATIAVSGQLGLASGVAERIAQRASGIPARLVELLRRAAAGEDITALPVSIRELLTERLQRLSSAQRRLFLVIALIGRPASVRLVAAAAHLSDSAARESVDVLRQDGLLEQDSDGNVLASTLAAQLALDAAGFDGRAFLSGWIAEALAREPKGSPAELARLFAAAGQALPAFEHARRAAYAALAMGAVTETLHFLNSARTFAATEQQQNEIESFLSSLGSGRRRLPASAKGSPIVDSATVDATATAAITTESLSEESRWQRLFPNWRILLGAAIATLVISAAVLATRPATLQPSARAPSTDTLVVADGETGRLLRYVTGDMSSGFRMSERANARLSDPPWLDSLSRPWINPIAAPRGMRVAIAKVTAAGSDIYVLSADKRDTLALVVGQGDARPLGWSPDGRWLLATTTRTLPNGAFDADLIAYRIVGSPLIVPVDSTARRAVTEAAWSPDGSRIAWVARVGAERQLEVFTSLADGSDLENVSRHPADDYHIAWSGDGELVAFTSMRDGNAELYAEAIRENTLWRLTRDPAQDDRGAFSLNGRLIAFESTRGGAAGVYVMPSLGGDTQRIGAGLPLSVLTWVGGGARYIDRVRVDAGTELRPGDTTTVRLAALDQFDEPIAVRGVQWGVPDSSSATLITSAEGVESTKLIAKRAGLVLVVGSVGRWRFDTAFVRVGDQPVVLVDVGDGDPFRAWRPIGVPAPSVMRTGAATSIALNADREWDSGVLSRAAVPLLPGLAFTATLEAPFSTASDAATTASLALVAPEDASAIDLTAPQFLRYASLTWSADPGRLVYAVGREVFSEPATAVGQPAALVIQLRVEQDSTVSFTIAGQQRWRSTLRVIDSRHDPRVHAWIAGRATGDHVRLSRVRLVLGSARPQQPGIGRP